MKKLLILLMCLTMLCGCTPRQDDEAHNLEAEKYIELLKNYTPRPKNRNQTVNHEGFEDFLEQVFIESMEADYTTLHFTVVDYRKMNIKKPEVSFGSADYGYDRQQVEYFKDQLKTLQSFDFDSLSYRQQYDYEALEYSIYETLAELCLSKYTRLFDHSGSTVNNIVTILSDFTFYDQESVDDYMILVADVERYLKECLTYTRQQQKDKIYMLDESINECQDYIDGIVDTGKENVLITSFDLRIDELDFLSESEKEKYKKQNAEIVVKHVLPSFTQVGRELENYRGKMKLSESALSEQNETYARMLYMVESSINMEPQDLLQYLMDCYDKLLAKLNTALYNPAAVEEYLLLAESAVSGSSDSKTTLEFLNNSLGLLYPDLGRIPFTVDELDESAGADSVTAYYWSAPIDALDQNIIRTNPNNMQAGFDSYSTLAHEGFPGHLYQHIYYMNTQPNHFRSAISFIGYTEGWAVQAQCDATAFLKTEYEETKDLLNILSMYYFLEYSILDLGFNCCGWKKEDMVHFMEEEGFYPIDNYLYNYTDYYEYGFTLQDIRDWFIEEHLYDDLAESLLEYTQDLAGTFLNYGGGYAFMYMLRDQAMKNPDFDMVTYNQTVLANGELPYVLLKAAIEEIY